ncbi:MAG: alpha/beta fold hydrolase, partial [Alphaproteobacteria bacterium]
MAQRNHEPVELAATIEGEGRPLVLLHGTASSSAMWQPMLAVLAAERRTIAIDLRGHGRSGPWKAGERPSLAAEAASVAARTAGFGGAFDLVGHSYGGAVALRLAMTMPRRISSLTLIEPAAFQILRDRDGVDRELLGRIAAIAEGIQHGAPSTEAAVARFVDYWNGAGFWTTLRADRQRAL